MLKLQEFCVWTFILLQCLHWVAGGKLYSLTQTSDDLFNENVTLVEKDKSDENENIPASRSAEIKAAPNPLNVVDPSLKSNNRIGRQLFYNPNFFYVQNFQGPIAKCVTSRGSVGACMTFSSCAHQPQPSHVSDIQQSPAEQTAFTYFQQQQDFCTFYDHFARLNYGICCTDPQNVSPAETTTQPPQDIPHQTETPENSDDSEVVIAELSDYYSMPLSYNNPNNVIDNDPVENLKRTSLSNNKYNRNRFKWSGQFGGIPQIQQWPPPLPTHPPFIGNWPPPLPTHPPNHHYPTHAPPFRPITISSTSTEKTITKKPHISGSNTNMELPLECGLMNLINSDQQKIVGGTSASPNEFPWIAAIFISGKHYCGGSLITNKHVLTAAHCVAKLTSWDLAAMTVNLGDHNIRTDSEVRHVTRRVKRLVRHKSFNFQTLHKDIAILTLSEPVQFTDEIQPICLPTSSDTEEVSYSGQTAIVAGWGSLIENGPQPAVLQKVQVPIWTNEECARKYGKGAPGGITKSMMCAGQLQQDSCRGDSGGPLVVIDYDHFVQVGIVSWGIGCGKGQYPGVYTRITSLLPWIYKNLK